MCQIISFTYANHFKPILPLWLRCAYNKLLFEKTLFFTPSQEAVSMANCAIVGINWGDEGKGRMVDYLTDRFDVVMFPVDGRIGNGYTRGARQFLDVFRTGLFVPMHFVASGFESAWRMKEFTDAKSVPFWCIRREGECCEVKEIIAQASR